MSAEIRLGDLALGEEHAPLVVPEIGINHGGSAAVARSMIDAALRAGARIVKFQCHVPDDEMTAAAKSIIPANADKSIYEVISAAALSESEERGLKQYCEERGLVYLSTPFSREALRRLERMDAPAYKIGSGECNHYPLVDLVASAGKPVILSTGMNGFAEIDKAVNILESRGVPYALLHCTNAYPAAPGAVRLNAVSELRARYPNAVVGLSDHCQGSEIALASIPLGASIIERHFTDVKDRPGPDIACSMDEAELSWLIKNARRVRQAMGAGKYLHAEEEATARFAFASLVSDRDLRAGEVLDREAIWARRPGTGEILARDYEAVLGKKLKADVPAGVQLKWSMFHD